VSVYGKRSSDSVLDGSIRVTQIAQVVKDLNSAPASTRAAVRCHSVSVFRVVGGRRYTLSRADVYDEEAEHTPRMYLTGPPSRYGRGALRNRRSPLSAYVCVSATAGVSGPFTD
jgi:hypothetical protein